MARLKLLRLSLTALKGLNKEKAITFINLIIFASFFALTASIISMYFENKIDSLDNKIINEETNILIYENQIQITPKVLKNIENVFYENYKLDDYLKLIAIWNDDDSSLITGRVTTFKPYFAYEAAANYGLEQMKQSMSDAILVANSVKDINEIDENNIEFKRIEKEIRQIILLRQKLDSEWALLERQRFSKKDIGIESAEEKEDYYKKFLPLNDRLVQILQDQINFFLNFNIKYFSRKKADTEKTIGKSEKELKILSNRESLVILLAFFLQLVVFISVQYFEVTMETANAKRTKKK